MKESKKTLLDPVDEVDDQTRNEGHREVPREGVNEVGVMDELPNDTNGGAIPMKILIRTRRGRRQGIEKFSPSDLNMRFGGLT